MSVARIIFTEEECIALLACHCFSGCDSLSSFKNKGRRTVFDTLMRYPKFIFCFSRLGQAWTPSDELCGHLERFVCRLYGFDGIDSIDSVRLKMIMKKKDNKLSLLPTKDSLKLHTKRAAYQTAIWRRCGDTHIKPPLPENHGWKVTEGLGLEPKWSLKADKSPAVTEFVQCGCKAGCVDNH